MGWGMPPTRSVITCVFHTTSGWCSPNQALLQGLMKTVWLRGEIFSKTTTMAIDSIPWECHDNENIHRQRKYKFILFCLGSSVSYSSTMTPFEVYFVLCRYAFPFSPCRSLSFVISLRQHIHYWLFHSLLHAVFWTLKSLHHHFANWICQNVVKTNIIEHLSIRSCVAKCPSHVPPWLCGTALLYTINGLVDDTLC